LKTSAQSTIAFNKLLIEDASTLKKLFYGSKLTPDHTIISLLVEIKVKLIVLTLNMNQLNWVGWLRCHTSSFILSTKQPHFVLHLGQNHCNHLCWWWLLFLPEGKFFLWNCWTMRRSSIWNTL